MLRQSKVSIRFKGPVLGTDLQDNSEFLSNKHWVLAEFMVISEIDMRFYNHEGKLVAKWQVTDFESIQIPVVDDIAPVIKEQKSYEYQAAVKKQRPAAWSAWTVQEDEQLLKEYGSGLNLDEIADVHQRTTAAIWSRLNKLGIYPEEHYGLGVRTQNRKYATIDVWKGKVPGSGEELEVCLGCGYVTSVRPCRCWLAKDTSGIKTWREHKYIRSEFGDIIGRRY
jgi:hypothetical protein